MGQGDPNPLVILEWAFLPHKFAKIVTSRVDMVAIVICRGREHLLALDGTDPETIYVPFDLKQWDFVFRMSQQLQCALVGFSGQISIHLPAHKLLQSLLTVYLLPVSKLSLTPLVGALSVFADGSCRTGHAVIVRKDTARTWESDVHVTTGSPQVVEHAVCSSDGQNPST